MFEEGNSQDNFVIFSDSKFVSWARKESVFIIYFLDLEKQSLKLGSLFYIHPSEVSDLYTLVESY